MSQTRLQRIMALFNDAAEMCQAEREAYLDRECGEDHRLKGEVLALLGWDSPTVDTLGEVVAAVAADLEGEEGAFIDQMIGPYRVKRVIGQGGMGRVLLAERADAAFERSVAIKVIRGWADDGLIRRFQSEREILATLDHPNIARLLDGGTTRQGLPYLVMEYVEGEPIGDYCRRLELPIQERIQLVQTLCHAVHYAHERSVVHRDLKPSNLFVTSEGVPKLLDFGIAKLLDSSLGPDEGAATVASRRALTPEYASPEQLTGGAVTTASDVYMLGLILYELLTDCKAHQFDNAGLGEIVRTITTKPITRPSHIVQGRQTDGRRGRPRSHPLNRSYRKLAGDLDNITLKALNKDPEGRYSSAFEMAEDLRRYLEGEPVTARAPQLRYILGKKLRKHWLGVIAAGVGAGGLLLLAGLWLNSRAEAIAQVASAQQFGQEIERMSADLRFEFFLPVHNIVPAKQRMRASMNWIREQMQAIGDPATGPGRHALGVAYLALHEDEAAREWLSRSWDSGYRPPEVATNLGLVLGRLYQKSLLEVNATSDVRVREAKLAGLQAQLRDPAVSFLRLGQSDGYPAIYAQGLIAFYEGKMQDALTRAREAYGLRQWFYPARLLEGDVFLAQALKAANSGEVESAREKLREAGGVFQEAVRMAPSDPDTHERLCEFGSSRMQIELDNGGDLEKLLAETTRACADASLADPERPGPHVILAQSYWMLGTYQRRHGHDPEGALQLAAESARRAIALDPAQTRPYMQLGTALQQLGAHGLDRGQDPRADLDAAVAAYQDAERFGLSSAALFNSLANAQAYRGEWEWMEGRDPREWMQQAVESYQKAIAADPESSFPRGNLGITYKDLGRIELDRGGDPMPFFRLSTENYEAALALNPNHPLTLNNVSHTWYQIGCEQMRHGQDPAVSLRKADGYLDRAVLLNPSYASPFVNRGQVDLLRAQVALADGRDPRPDLDQAREALQEAIRINPGHRSQYYAHLGRAELLQARWAIGQGLATEPFLSAARRQAKSIEHFNPRDPDRWALAAEASLLEGWAQMQGGRSPEQDFERALSVAQEGLKEHPDGRYFNELRLELRLRQAEWLHDRGEECMAILADGVRLARTSLSDRPRDSRTRALLGALLTVTAEVQRETTPRREALDTLTQALAENRYLSREFNSYLERARTLE